MVIRCPAWRVIALLLLTLHGTVGVLRVAVIGAGIGGASFSEFLSREYPSAELTIYERSDRVGGRIQACSEGIELGASMAILQNTYMRRFATQLNHSLLLASERPGRGSGHLGILSDLGAEQTSSGPHKLRGMAFLESASKLWTLMSMLWRYGPITFFRLRSQGRSDALHAALTLTLTLTLSPGQALISAFDELYRLQDAHLAYRTPSALWEAAKMTPWAEQNCSATLRSMLGQTSDGLDLPVATELVAGLMNNNYGQDWAGASALVCMTAVAPLAAGGSSAAWSIPGGNEKVVQGLLRDRQVRLGRTVTAVEKTGRQYHVRHRSSNTTEPRDHNEESLDEFDYVVIAMPLEASSSMDLSTLQAPPPVQMVQYQHVHTTLVWGTLRAQYFGVSDVRRLNTLTDILTSATAATPFNSIGHYNSSSTRADWMRWKLFSKEPLTEKHLEEVFEAWDSSTVVQQDWNTPGAYPKSKPEYSALNFSFVLDESEHGMVLFPSAIEFGTSAMEVMAVAARNAALLVTHKESGRSSGLLHRKGASCASPSSADDASHDGEL